MKLTKIKPKFIEKYNPRIGLITLASDFRIEKNKDYASSEADIINHMNYHHHFYHHYMLYDGVVNQFVM